MRIRNSQVASFIRAETSIIVTCKHFSLR